MNNEELQYLLKNLTPEQKKHYLEGLDNIGYDINDDDTIEFVRNDDYLMMIEYYNEVVDKLKSMSMYDKIEAMSVNCNVYAGCWDFIWNEIERYEKLYEEEVKKRKPWENFAWTLNLEEQNDQVVISL